jgi:hypothetical protein
VLNAGVGAQHELVLGLVAQTAGGAAPSAETVRAANPAAVMGLLTRAQVVAALGVPLVARHGELLPGWFRERVTATRDFARHAGLMHHAVTGQLASALADRGIASLPLKGTTLAEAAHGDLGARMSADIDLLVAPERLDAAMQELTALGWREGSHAPPAGGLPQLHRVLVHEDRPPVELHWRVHWYEDEYAADALARAEPTPERWMRLQPGDELAFLLLFFAREGFAGLRQVVDLAAWWKAVGAAQRAGAAVHEVTERYPALAPALGAASVVTERLASLPSGALLTPQPRLSAAQRVALRLANPWLEGSLEQVLAEVSLIDGLLAPPGTAPAFVRRAIVPPRHRVLARRPELARAGRPRLLAARAAHAVRLLARYVAAGPRLIRRRRR